ncbi:MAG TPA: hypothetical protein VG326_03150 [Tepidisphaeraceae bacterium]|jgi:hypothetical protein|nr:hypothetical protein [Tepidisphaeraceae bacterium]
MKPTAQSATFITAALLLFGAAATARAEHFEMQATVSSKSDKATAFSDTFTATRPEGFKPRPVCHAKAGEELVFQFFCSSNFPHDSLKAVTVRYYVVLEAKAGQKELPSKDSAITQGSFVLDFKPNTGKVGLRERFKAEKTGTYLVRVESDNSDNDHEHFSAVDLVVE